MACGVLRPQNPPETARQGLLSWVCSVALLQSVRVDMRLSAWECVYERMWWWRGQKGFHRQQTSRFLERTEFSLAPLPASLSVFILKTCFQCTLLKSPGWSQVCDSQVQVQVRKLPAEVCKRPGCSEECQLRSSQELEEEPEPRTLHGKSAPSSSGRNSCLRILICLAKLSSCDQGGNPEPKLDRIIQAEVGPFVGRKAFCQLTPECLPVVSAMAYLASSLLVHGHLVIPRLTL